MKNLKQRKPLLLLAFLILFFGVGRAEETTTTLNISNGSITFTAEGYTQEGSSATTGAGPVTITGTTTDNTKKVSVTGGEHQITLNGASIQFNDGWAGSPGTCAFSIGNGAKVTLLLKGENTLKSGYDRAGIQVSAGATLEIKEGGNGSLTATGGNGGSGIGGGRDASGGTITISGGKVTATGGGGSGIGGGYCGSGGTITISGGKVTATGGSEGSGIGGGYSGSGGTIIISGGEVTATGGSEGSGIGGGNYGSGGTITISGGEVTAIGGSNGSGIGGGNNNAEGNLAITSGTITTSSINADVTVKSGDGVTLAAPEGTNTITLTVNHSLTVEKNASLTINTSLENKMHCLVLGTLKLGTDVSITNSDGGVFFASNEADCPLNESITKPREGEFLTEDLVLIGGGTKDQDYTVEGDISREYQKITIKSSTPLTFRTPWPVFKSSILVPGGVTADITLEDYRIGGMRDGHTYAPINLSRRAVATVHLLGSNELIAGNSCAGIQVPQSSSLTIKGEGKLSLRGGLYAAGIGGGKNEVAGAIRIESGTITAKGGDTDGDGQGGGAGIGGGGSSSNIYGSSHTKISITGGHIVANGGHRACGIGTGRAADALPGAEINIQGGYVEAGPCGSPSTRNCGTINISGGTIKTNELGGASGTLNITGGSVKAGTIPDGVKPKDIYCLTLETVDSKVNSVSVDNTPYYIDRGYPDTDDNKNKLYLYVPKETQKVYVREDNKIATYSVIWSDDTPTATRQQDTSTPNKKPVLSFPIGGYTGTVATKEYQITDITIAESGSGSAPTAADVSGLPALNSVSVKLLKAPDGPTVYESRAAASATDNKLSDITLDFSDQLPDGLPAGTYTMELQYGGDAGWLASDVVTTTLKIEKKVLAATDFSFTPPSGTSVSGSPVYNGTARVAKVTPNSGVAGKIGAVTLFYCKKDNSGTPQSDVLPGALSEALSGVPSDVSFDIPSGALSEAIDAGTYTVKILVEEGSDYKATTTPLTSEAPEAPWQFTIAPMEVTVTPDAGQILFNNGTAPAITYTQSPAFIESDVSGGKISITGALSFEKDGSGDGYHIVNPADGGGLALAGEAAGNYTLQLSSSPVPVLLRPEAGPADVEAQLPDGVTPNENGWIATSPLTLTAPQGFTFDGGTSTTHEISADGMQTYTLIYKGNSYQHTLPIDATAPPAPASPAVNGLSATFTLTDATSGIASYTVSEGGTVIAAYPAAAADAASRSDAAWVDAAAGSDAAARFDAASRSEAAANGVQTGPASLTYTYTGTTPGDHTLQFSVTDMAGNTLAASNVTFTLTKPADPDPDPDPSDPSDPVDPDPDPSDPAGPDPLYTVTLPSVEGAATDPVAGDYEVEAWGSFRFFLTLDAEYDASHPVVSTSRGETIVPRASDGAYVIKLIRTDLAIRIDGIVKNPSPVANGQVSADGVQVRTSGSALHIHLPVPEAVAIYTFTGRLYKRYGTLSGDHTIRLPQGNYIVLAGGKRLKVWVGR